MEAPLLQLLLNNRMKLIGQLVHLDTVAVGCAVGPRCRAASPDDQQVVPTNGRARNPLRAAPRRAWAFAEAMAHKAECPPYPGASIANHDGSRVKMRIDSGMSIKHT